MMDEILDVPNDSGAIHFAGYDPIAIHDPLKSALAHYSHAITLLDDDEEVALLEAVKPQDTAMTSSFLDAMIESVEQYPEQDAVHISAVNSDEAGLYRMFINVSP